MYWAAPGGRTACYDARMRLLIAVTAALALALTVACTNKGEVEPAPKPKPATVDVAPHSYTCTADTECTVSCTLPDSCCGQGCDCARGRGDLIGVGG